MLKIWRCFNIILTNRQKNVLKIIVDEYIRTAKPIGSSNILNCINIKISPALIRNECVILEKKGLIQKIHLSSGRIPSTIGYRYYINNLIENNTNIDPIKEKIEKLFIQRDSDINDILEKTSEIISEMTNLAILVIGESSSSDLRVKKIALLPIDNYKAAIIIILSNGHIENKIFNFTTISLDDLKRSVDIFNKRLENTLIKEVYEKFTLMYPILEKEVKKCELFLKELVLTIANFSKIKKTTHGIQYMLKNPEFDNSQTIKHAIKLIESFSSFEFFQNMALINKNINNYGGINISIGEDFNNKDFNDISVISTNYKIDNENTSGKLALIGPKRVDYNKIMQLLYWLSDKLLKYSNEKEDKNEQA